MSSFTIRPAVAIDARAIAEIHYAGWQIAYAHVVSAEQMEAKLPERRIPFWQARIADLDSQIETEHREYEQNSDKLARLRNLRRAIKDLVLREAYNADLRVIRASGRGMDAPYRQGGGHVHRDDASVGMGAPCGGPP